MKLESPVSYQGAKQRIASQLVDIIKPTGIFYDLCCGSGSISIELVNRGYNPSNLRMIDAGPWGMVWEAIGKGDFSLERMKYWCDQIPKDRIEIKGFMEDLSRQSVDGDAVYIYLLLQASSFGGKAIWIKDRRWQNCSFRSYWQPTATSSRRSPVNPMMPMPDTLYNRLITIVDKMHGVVGGCVKIEHMAPNIGIDSVVYIDPPYDATTGYGHILNVKDIIPLIQGKIYISEGQPVPNADETILISNGREKGGISGERKKANQEWLSLFNKKVKQ